MSEVARQFNIMAETLRKGVAGMEGARQRSLELGLEQERMEHDIASQREDRTFRSSQAKEDKRRYEETTTEDRRRWEAGSTEREAKKQAAQDTIESREMRKQWESQVAGSEAVGINLSNAEHVGWIQEGGALKKSLWQKHGIETVYEDVDGDGKKDLRFYKNGKAMSNKFMSGNSVALAFALEYDYDKSQRGKVQKAGMELQELVDGEIDQNSDTFKTAQARLREAQEIQSDMYDNPSKYEYLKLERAEGIYGNMRPAFKERFKGLIDIQRLRAQEMIKLDVANNRASGKNLKKYIYTKDVPGGVRQMEVYGPGSGMEGTNRHANMVADGYDLGETTISKGFIKLSDRQGLTNRKIKYQKAKAKLETSGAMSDMQQFFASESDSGVLAQLMGSESVKEGMDYLDKQIQNIDNKLNVPKTLEGPGGQKVRIDDEWVAKKAEELDISEEEVIEQLLLYKTGQ